MKSVHYYKRVGENLWPVTKIPCHVCTTSIIFSNGKMCEKNVMTFNHLLSNAYIAKRKWIVFLVSACFEKFHNVENCTIETYCIIHNIFAETRFIANLLFKLFGLTM